jgi:hypothetical protein
MSEQAPVRIKLYGLLPMTRRRYVFQLVIGAGLAVGLLAAWWLRWPTLREELRMVRTPTMDRLIAFWDLVPWVIIAFAAVQAVEAWYVLRLFARKEKEAAAAPAPAASPPSEPAA